MKIDVYKSIVKINIYKSSRGYCRVVLTLEWFLMYTGPGFAQDGIDDLEVGFLLYLNSLSWGGALVDEQSSDLIQWSGSSRTFPHWNCCILQECKVIWIVFYGVPSSLSTCPLPSGWYLLVSMPFFLSYDSDDYTSSPFLALCHICILKTQEIIIPLKDFLTYFRW